jgi:hypothetical protein
MDKPVAIVPSAQEFYSGNNIQLVKENFLFTGQIHRLGVKVSIMNQFIFLNTAF